MTDAMPESESSSQALERHLADQLAALHFAIPNDDVEYMARLVEADGLEEGEKVEGLRGMLEGILPSEVTLGETVDDVLRGAVREWENLRLQAQDALEGSDSGGSTSSEAAEPDEAELAAARKQALLRQYAYLEGGPDQDPSERDPNAPSRGVRAAEAEAKKAADERRKMIQDAVKLDGKKKKHKKGQEVDLLAPNLNKEKLAYKAQLDREAQKQAAQGRKDRDKAALDKQRADAAKAKAEKQKKAAKQERRA